MKIDEMKYENLFAGSAEVITDAIAVAKGQQIPQFSIVSINTDGKVVLPTKEDTTSKVYGIIAEDVSTIGLDKESVAYLAGEFNANTIIVPEGFTLDDFKVQLREIGIFLKENIKQY